MRALTTRRLMFATSGVAMVLAACNAITGLDGDFNEDPCFGGACADGSVPDGSMSAMDHTAPPPDGRAMPDASAMPDGFVADTWSMPDTFMADVTAQDVGVDAPVDAGVDTGPVCGPTWGTMSAAPIVPPFHMAGLDLHGAGDAGITIGEVAAAACEVLDGGNQHPNMHSVSWGDAGQMTFVYDNVSGRYYQMVLTQGYTGALDFKGADGGASYHVAIGQPITKNGAPYELDWSGTPDGGRSIQQELTELKNAMNDTYMPGAAPDSTNCSADGTCLISNNAGQGYFGIRPPTLALYMVFNDTINQPNVPSIFYTFSPYPATYNDFGQQQYWTAFDTTQIPGGNVKGAAGIVYDQTAIYIVPSGATTPVARYDVSTDAFTSPSSWQTFDVTQLTPKPQGFSGSTFDRYYNLVYLAGTTGIVAQYDTSQSFVLPGSWSTFDTTKLTPAATGFAGAGAIRCNNTAAGVATVFVPSQDGVAVMYQSTAGFTTAANWVSYNLATKDPRLTKFHGAVAATGALANPKYLYLVPNGDTLLVRWNPTLAFNGPNAWETFDLATIPNTPGSYSTGVYDGQYLYLSPGTNGGPVVRYDTTLPFNQASSWQVGLVSLGKTTATSWDGRYIYFSGPTTSIERYDTTMSFTGAPTAWTGANVGFQAGVAGFVGNTGDGRYLYFAPDTFSTVMRFDDKFPPFGPPRWESLSTY